MAADPAGTRQLLADLTPVVPVREIGAVPPPAAPPAADSGYPAEWLTPQDRKPKTELGGRVTFGDD